MRLLSFTPMGGTEYIIPPAVEYSVDIKRRSAIVNTARADASYDQFGDTSPLDLGTITFPFQMVCPTVSKIDDLRLAFSKRGILKAYQQDGTLRQTWFKCTDFMHPRSRSHANYADFTIVGNLYPYWRSVYIRNIVAAGTPFALTTRGNADVYDTLQIQFTAAGTPTAFTLNNLTNSYGVTWVGTLTNGQTITINVPAITVVKTGGVNNIGNVAYASSTQIGLFKLAAGVNNLSYSITAGSGSFALAWRDTWF